MFKSAVPGGVPAGDIVHAYAGVLCNQKEECLLLQSMRGLLTALPPSAMQNVRSTEERLTCHKGP